MSLDPLAQGHDPFIFSIVPIEVAMDLRLTSRHLRVLIALLSFRNKNTDTVWPSREQLSARCGLRITRVSNVTSELEQLGWLKKTGQGGNGKATRYQITVPEIAILTRSQTVPVLGTVPNLGTVPKLGTLGAETVPNLGTGNRTHHKEEHTIRDKEPCRVAKKSAPKTTPARATRLPPNWELPDEYSQWAVIQTGWAREKVYAVSEIFKDHWLSKAGQGALKTDWFATWRNWIRRDQAGGKHESTSGILAGKRAAEWQRDVEMHRWANGELESG